MIKKIYFGFVISAVVGMAATPLVVTAVPALETKYKPAAAPMELLVALPTDLERPKQGAAYYKKGGSRTAIWLQSARLRHPNCAPRFLAWFKGDRRYNNVPIKSYWGRPIVRDDGVFVAGAWIVDVEIDDLQDTFSDVFHQCQFMGVDFPWLTRSRFWN